MTYTQARSIEHISNLWGVANNLIEEYGKIMAPIVFLGYKDESRFAMLDGGNFDSQEEFIGAIQKAVDEVNANSAIMIASARVTTRGETEDEEVEEGDVVLLFYRTEGVDVQQVAKVIQPDQASPKKLGKVKNLNQLMKNKFLDGLFDKVH